MDKVYADESDLLAEAAALYQGDATSESDLRAIREILDQITVEYPSSDLTVKILLQETVDGVDIAAVDARIAAVRRERRPDAPSVDVPAINAQGAQTKSKDATVIPAAPQPPDSAKPWSDLLGQAATLYRASDTLDPAGKNYALLEVRRILDQIVNDDPSSELSVRIMLQETIDGIDVAALSVSLAQQPDATPPLIEVPPAKSDAKSLSDARYVPATAQSEQELSLDKAAIRDLQARLLVLGFDPNGIDGALGRGTRSAVSAWQTSAAIPATGFLDGSQLQALKMASQAALDVWLAEPDNQRLHEPPPPLPLTGSAVSGSWAYTARCGRNSSYPGQTFGGALQIRYSGNTNFDGTARNDQGFNGTIRGQIKGRTITGRVSWGLLVGSQTFSGKFAEQSMVINARDSDGCSITARKK